MDYNTYTKYMQNQEAAARKRFQNHRATVIQRDENFFILDWRNISGSVEYFVRYILDIKRGTLVVSGDLGSCVASWYNTVQPEKLAGYLEEVPYFMGKFQCSSAPAIRTLISQKTSKRIWMRSKQGTSRATIRKQWKWMRTSTQCLKFWMNVILRNIQHIRTS